MRLFLVRHGETVGNASNTHQTSTTELSDIGKNQAQFVAHRFKTIPVDAIVASDFTRTKQTASIINSVLNLAIETTPLLRERKFPTEIEGKHTGSKEAVKIKELLNQHFADRDWHYSDEENFFDLRLRAQKCLAYLSSRSEKRLLAVTHGGFMSMLVAELIFGPKLDNDTFRHFTHSIVIENTGITVCDNDTGRWKLVSWNDHAHLGK